MANIIRKCPKCSERMFISEFSCLACKTTIRGEFEIENGHSAFDRLNEEDRYFALIFLQTGGRIQDVERVMGISYPTVKAKLKEIQDKLSGVEIEDDPDQDEYFDRRKFKSEMRDFRKQIRERVRSQVKASLAAANIDPISFDEREKDPCCSEFSFRLKNTEQKRTSETTDTETSNLKSNETKNRDRIKDILDKLERGEIDPDKALREMNKKSESTD